MGGWMDDLKKEEDARELKRRQNEAWRLRCDRLIADVAPTIWRALAERIATDVRRLAEKFPDDDSKYLEFDDQGGQNRFTVASHSGHRNLTACYLPDARMVDLEFRSRADLFSTAQVVKEKMDFFVSQNDEVGISLHERKSLEGISELLIKRLL
jgi:hypothetical protein